MDGHDEDCAAEIGPAAKEVEIGDLLVRMFFCDLRLDELVFGQDIRIVDVAMCVELRERL